METLLTGAVEHVWRSIIAIDCRKNCGLSNSSERDNIVKTARDNTKQGLIPKGTLSSYFQT